MSDMVAHVRVNHRSRVRACATKEGAPKVAYHTKRDAKAHLRLFYGKTWRQHGMDIYRCSDCGLWHVGHRR